MTKRATKLRTILNDCATSMPPLEHSQPGEKFDIMQSAVAEFLASDPKVRQYLFDSVSGAYGLIVYDRETGTWHGKDWRPDDEQ